jgi:D-alanine-D-alanine ligase
MTRKLNVTVLVDKEAIPASDPEFTAAPETTDTEYQVIGALRNLRHNVSVLGAVDDIAIIVNSITEQSPDLVFNLTEQFAGDRRFDTNIAALLEMTGIPFTGSGHDALMLCRDKRLCKQLLSLHRIRVPGFISLPADRKTHVPKSIRYPLVVKPAFEDSSEGISNASLVSNEDALRERARFVRQRWRQPAIAEEYIEGRELYVSILGNKKLTVLPVRECFFKSGQENGPLLATYRVKWNVEYRKKWNIEFGFAKLDPPVLEDIRRICKKVYRVLQLRDYGRIDIRLTPDNRLVILEANPNPDLACGEEVAEAAEKAGFSYDAFIDRIISLALNRYA